MLCFRKLSLAKKFLDNMGEYQNYPPKVFRLTMPKNLVSEAYSVALISEIGMFFLRGLCRDFSVGTFLSRVTQKLRKGTSLC